MEIDYTVQIWREGSQFMHSKFARIHRTLRVTPPMEAGVSNHVWSLEEILGLVP